MESEEQQHTTARCDKEDTATNAIDEERSNDSDAQVPNLKDSVDEQLDGRVCDANSIENLVEIVRDETIA